MSQSHPIPTVTGGEVDAFSRRSRRVVSFPRGETKRLKTGYNRRVRHLGKAETRREAW